MGPHDVIFFTTLVVASLVELILYFTVEDGGEKLSTARSRSSSTLAGRGAK